eukprot:UN06199
MQTLQSRIDQVQMEEPTSHRLARPRSLEKGKEWTQIRTSGSEEPTTQEGRRRPGMGRAGEETAVIKAWIGREPTRRGRRRKPSPPRAGASQ